MNGTDRRFTDRTVEQDFNSGSVVDNVFRWDSNNHVPFREMLEDFVNSGLISLSVLETSCSARKLDNELFAKKYRESQKNRSSEEIAEERAMARAAHGKGVKLINVITGETYIT